MIEGHSTRLQKTNLMQAKKLLTLCVFCLSALLSCAQADKEWSWNVETNTIEDSQYLLQSQMNDSLYKSIVGRDVKLKDRIIKTEKEALDLGKSIFLKEFDSGWHEPDRRYLVHFIKGYWIVKGLLPEGMTGGTLVTVIDSESGNHYYSQVWK